MIRIETKLIPEEILKDSVLVHLVTAYFSVSKQLERKTGCSQTRGFILSTLQGGAERNQNQIAKLLGFDRTVVHRSIGTMLKDGLISKVKAPTGRSFVIRLTPNGEKYRESLIHERKAADDRISRVLKAKERTELLRLLKVVAETELYGEIPPPGSAFSVRDTDYMGEDSDCSRRAKRSSLEMG